MSHETHVQRVKLSGLHTQLLSSYNSVLQSTGPRAMQTILLFLRFASAIALTSYANADSSRTKGLVLGK